MDIDCFHENLRIFETFLHVKGLWYPVVVSQTLEPHEYQFCCDKSDSLFSAFASDYSDYKASACPGPTLVALLFVTSSP